MRENATRSRGVTRSLGSMRPRSVVMTNTAGASSARRPNARAYASFPRKYNPLRKLNVSPIGAPSSEWTSVARSKLASGFSSTFARRPSQRAGESRKTVSIDKGSFVALTATIYNFDIQLADVDRGVYETLALKAARQPSETEEYLVTRV